MSVTEVQRDRFGPDRSGSSSARWAPKEKNGTEDQMKYKHEEDEPYCFSRLEIRIYQHLGLNRAWASSEVWTSICECGEFEVAQVAFAPASSERPNSDTILGCSRVACADTLQR